MADILDPEWEDKEVVDFIYNFLDKDDKKRVTRAQIQDVLDFIVDYYDSKDLVEEAGEDDDEEIIEEAEIDEDEMFEFVRTRVLSEDHLANIDDDLLAQIIEGEYRYGLSIGIYSEGDDDEDYGTYED